MIASTIDHYLCQTRQEEEQQLYAHLLDCLHRESPRELLARFRRLFIEGKGYQDSNVRLGLEKIIKSKQAEQKFQFVLSRCCHILINYWYREPQLQAAIPELVALFEHLPSSRTGAYRTSGRLRKLVKNFTSSEEYLKLQRLALVISPNRETNDSSSPSVGNLINRYPYLYEHCLLSDDSSDTIRKTVRQIKAQMERRFEFELSRSVTARVRLVQIGSARQLSTVPGRIIQPVKNPTLLSESELGTAVKHFIGKVERGYTYRDLAQSFLSHSKGTSSYQAFKKDLYSYLVSSIDPKYGKFKFNYRLYQQLQNTLPHCNAHKPSEFLILRTASQLLNFFVESPQQMNHYVFFALITNLGITPTIGLLLKLVLLCPKVKPYLEKRFSILFSHYESSSIIEVPWLVKSLENLHIAFSVHFGKADLSGLKEMI